MTPSRGRPARRRRTACSCARRSRPPSATAATSGGRRSTSSAGSTRRSAPATARRSTSASVRRRRPPPRLRRRRLHVSTGAGAASAIDEPSRPTASATSGSSTSATRGTRRGSSGPRDDPDSPLARSLEAARRALLGLTVGVDALCLGPDRMGTQQVAVETIRALARRKDVKHLVVFVPPSHPRYVHDLRDELPDVEFVGVNPFVGPARPARRHRLPAVPGEHARRARLPAPRRRPLRRQPARHDRLREPGLLRRPTPTGWPTATSPGSRCSSPTASPSSASTPARTAAAEDLLAERHPDRRRVLRRRRQPDVESSDARPATHRPIEPGYRAVHRDVVPAQEPPVRPRGVGRAAPPRVGRASSCSPGRTRPTATRWPTRPSSCCATRELRPDVVTLASVTEAEKRWLYRHAALVLYPSSIEGFGLVPFEAAGHGVATLARAGAAWTRCCPRTSRRSTASTSAPRPTWRGRCSTTTGWRRAWSRRCVARGQTFEWERTGDRLMELFQEVLARPRQRAMVIEGESGRPTGVMARRRPRRQPGRHERPGAHRRRGDRQPGREAGAVTQRVATPARRPAGDLVGPQPSALTPTRTPRTRARDGRLRWRHARRARCGGDLRVRSRARASRRTRPSR